MEPRRWEDVCAALLFEEEREPEGEVGSVRGAEGGGWALECIHTHLVRRRCVVGRDKRR